jgi:hypothetical protein
MKKALAGALFGGLLIFFVPQAASGGAGAGHPVVTHQESAESGSGCTMTQGDSGRARQDPPGQGHAHYDKEHHDGPED